METAGYQGNKGRNVLLPIDSSQHSQRAFNWFVEHIFKKGDSICFMHVVQPFEERPVFGNYMHRPVNELEGIWRVVHEDVEKGRLLNQNYLDKAKDHNIPAKAFLHIDSKPSRAILDSCDEHKIDLIVIGNRGLGKLKRIFLGSVSTQVIHQAHVPVFMVPPVGETTANSDSNPMLGEFSIS